MFALYNVESENWRYNRGSSGRQAHQIQVTTKPSMALYESTVKHPISEDTYTVNDKEISRVNVYGDQPHCVESEIPMLRPYCYCKIQL